MTQFTTNDLAVRVLKDLNIIAAEEVPASADMAYTLETIRCEFALMEADGVKFSNHGTSVDSINEALFTELSRRMGFAVGASFGVMSAATAEAGKLASDGLIRRLTTNVKVPELANIERAARGARIRDPIISQ